MIEPSDYGNLTVIRISSENLWTPDTFVYTTADQSGFLLPQAGAYFVVSSTGNIFWPNPLTQMRVRCRMGIAWVIIYYIFSKLQGHFLMPKHFKLRYYF